MGIKGLLPFLRKTCPEVIRILSMREFSGQKVAIDGNLLGFRLMAVVEKKMIADCDVAIEDPDRNEILHVWLQDVCKELHKYLKWGITPIVVFDGPHPAKKKETQQKRGDVRTNARERVEQLREELRNQDILCKDNVKLNELRTAMQQCCNINREDISKLKTMLVEIGIPMIQARGEAEKMCTMMARDKLVAAVVSADTDNIACGCPLLISAKDKDRNGRNEYDYDAATGIYYDKMYVIAIDEVLSALHLTMEQFVDLCIMMKCDYNENVPYIGPQAAYKLIRTFGSIDGIPRRADNSSLIDTDRCKGMRLGNTRTYDLDCLEVEYCREQFRPEGHMELWNQEDDINNELVVQDKWASGAREHLTSLRLKNFCSFFKEQYDALPRPPTFSTFCLEAPPTPPSPPAAAPVPRRVTRLKIVPRAAADAARSPDI